ncbi:MAG: hypothetical protein U9Q35_01115 [Pseudomonadota bacterium]|nr:hypothetical protein [Pseudomonadota bacterium]
MTDMDKYTVDRIYELVLGGANRVLRNCRTFSVEVLKLDDPTYTQIASHLRKLCEILEDLDDDSEMRVTKALEYTNHIRLIAAAIDTGDQEVLDRHVGELEKRSFM